MNKTHPIANYMYPFFYQFLIDLKGLSTNSVFSYRDAIKLLLRFASDFFKKAVYKLNIEDLDDKLILNFLDHLEVKRNCSIQTRNARLAAVRTFFDFISREEPELLLHCQKIRSIPLKRTEHKSICYLENDELKAVLDSVDINS